MTRNEVLQRVLAIRDLSSLALRLLESHPLTSEREAEVRSHVVWLRICVTAADNHLAIRIESPRCRYAGQLGVQIRPLNDAPAPGSPSGSEFLYGVSSGRRFAGSNGWAVIAGPEIFGQTAFHQFFNGETGTEALLTGRLEHSGTGRNLRIKLGAGHALVQNFGAAQWRIVLGVELYGHT